MNPRTHAPRQSGFSLIEILVGLIIGLLATLVIMQMFAFFEGQKRTTTGGADAQTNAGLALYTMQREAAMAGYGMPVFSTKHPALLCDPLPTHPGPGIITGTGLFPVFITEGGAGNSDTLTIRYGSTQKGGIPIEGTFAGNSVTLVNNLGCDIGDTALIVNGAACAMQTVTALPDNTHITLAAAPAVTSGNIACMGGWNEIVFAIAAGGGLTRNGVPNTADVVNMQVQYGLTDATPSGDSTIVAWTDAAGAPDINTRKRIRAVRVALVTRNGNYEKNVVSYACNVADPKPNQTCIWKDDPAPVNLDLTGLGADWNHYRYAVNELIIPLRAMIWSSNTL